MRRPGDRRLISLLMCPRVALFRNQQPDRQHNRHRPSRHRYGRRQVIPTAPAGFTAHKYSPSQRQANAVRRSVNQIAAPQPQKAQPC